ncbi:MAG: acyl carrier protein [Acidobacteriales bacterium]|nr:acyl carrier protein [Terriglobales bacterium]
MADEVEQKVLAVIAQIKRIPPDTVSLQSSFEELGIDSLDGMNILFELENEFDINIPDEQARSIRSVQEMVEGVKKLLAAPTASTSATE